MVSKTKKALFTSHVGNFQKFNRPFMRMLRDKGYEVHYASMGEEEILDCDKSFTVPFARSPFKLSNVHAYKQLKKIIDRENYDIIHTHTPMGSVVTRLAARDVRKRGTRVIYTAHGFHFFKGAPLVNWLIYYPVEKWMARHTDMLITINNEDHERAKRKFKTNVQYVPGVGVDESRFKPHLTKKRRNELRASLGIKPDDFVMIYPAELNKNKNQTMLINVMEILVKDNPNIHLLLPGKDSLNGYHARQIAAKGLGENIHLLGYRSDIPQLLIASDLSISASYREGLPVHIMEAMMAGLPIVSTNCRGASELIVNDKNGYLVETNDVSAMVEKITLFIDQKSLHTSLSKSSLTKAKQYSLDTILPRMQELYRPSGPVMVLQVVTIMNRAGLETMLMNYYRAIDRSKVQFDFLVHRDEKGDYEDEIIALGGRIHRMPAISLRSVGAYRQKLIAFLKDHPEYTAVHSHLDSLSALPLAAAKEAGVTKRIAHSHTSSFDRNKKFYVRQITKRFIPFYATDYMGCSAEALVFMFGRAAKQGIVVPNAIDAKKFAYKPVVRKKVRKELGINDSFIVGHVGRFTYPKNHEFLIEVFAELKKRKDDAVLLLVGTGEGERTIKDKVKELGLQKSVKFLGLRTDIADLMQAMDVFVMPSRYEGLPVVSVEAQAAGLPCVFSDVVTNELDVTGNSYFISLDAPIDEWSSVIMAEPRISRHDTLDKIISAGYDVQAESVKLRGYYLSDLVERRRYR